MKNLVILFLICGVTFAQDCPGNSCESSPCEKASLADKPAAAKAVSVSDTIVKLEASAAKGCKTSAGKLEALCKTAGVKDVAALKKSVAAYEKYAPMGCGTSKQALDKMGASLAAKPARKMPLSARIEMLVKGEKNGCAKSAAALKPLREMAGDKPLVAFVKELETKAANGCQKCVKEIATMEARLPAAPAAPMKLSQRVAKFVAGEKNGCAKSAAALKPLYDAAGTGCCKALVEHVTKLETKAAGGCQKSVKELDALGSKLPASPAAPKAEKAATGAKSDCEDCTDCADCSDCTGKSCPSKG